MNHWKNILLIYNPHAGRSVIKQSLHQVIDILSNGGALVTAYPTKAKADALRFVGEIGASSERFPYDVVVVSGGDGTLHEVVNAMMQLPEAKRVPIGYIPAGSTNDFATSHLIPTSLESAAKTIVNGQVLPFDIGRFGSRYFTYVAAFGSFTDVTYDTPQEIKNIWGHMAYVIEGARRLPGYKPEHLRIIADAERFEGDFYLGMIANTTSVGGLQIKGGDISLRDGYSELILIRYFQDPLQNLSTLNAVLAQDFSSPAIIYRKAITVRFLSDHSIPWTLDGEYGGEHSDVIATTCKGALRFICP
ncbi:MAG: YegS/Rv2252/BmrU family lipid kinase [Firmicutes bacterium]|nr:YegS/Rv2252/BmrU family lipid kinase [Bacillota bacterium]